MAQKYATHRNNGSDMGIRKGNQKIEKLQIENTGKSTKESKSRFKLRVKNLSQESFTCVYKHLKNKLAKS